MSSKHNVTVIRTVNHPQELDEVKGKSCALTVHHAMKTYWGSGGIAPLIL
jgi:hypothetical protein